MDSERKHHMDQKYDNRIDFAGFRLSQVAGWQSTENNQLNPTKHILNKNKESPRPFSVMGGTRLKLPGFEIESNKLESHE